MIDLRFSWTVFYIVVLCFLFPFLPLLIDPFLMLTAVRAIENIQAFLLFGVFVFTLLYMQPWKLADGKKHFWFWAAAWWLMLCGRSTSWGRDYFPDVPKIYFRVISIVLIGTVVFMLCSKHLRSEIMVKLKHLSLPFWPLLLAVSGLIISDAVEHLRGVYHIFVLDLKYQNFIEELYEFPLIVGLFLMAWSFMVRDRDILTHILRSGWENQSNVNFSHSKHSKS